MRWKLRIKKGWIEFRMKVIRLRKFYISGKCDEFIFHSLFFVFSFQENTRITRLS